jgi:hypothetical protein
MKDRVLFVTKGGESCEEGFSYVTELALTLNAGIDVLFIFPEQSNRTFDDIMVMAAFAEAGDFKTVKKQMEEEQRRSKEEADTRIRSFIERARRTVSDLVYEISFSDISSAIKSHLKNRPYIDMVLLSPSLSANKKSIDLKKLIENISKPIVYISKPLSAEI